MSANDLSGLLFVPVITLPLLPLSNRASTDSWSILFSFLTIISGALSSSNLFNLLFLFITLLYKSLRSEVANLPPSRGTRGLKSGGSTGKTFITIHSGLLPESLKASSNFSLFDNFLSLVSEFVSGISSLITLISSSISSSSKRIWTASAPIPAVNSSPNSSYFSTHSSSVNISPFSSSVKPGSVTI